MSTDHPQDGDATPQPAAPAETSSPLRIVLFVILGVMIVALAYDYLYARKQPDEIAMMVLPQIDTTSAVSNVDPRSMDEVIELVGREPEEKIEGTNYWQIKYSWRAGLPWKTYDLYLVFTKGDPPIYYSHSVGGEPVDYPAQTISESMSEEEREAIYEAVRKYTGEADAEDSSEEAEDTSEETASSSADEPTDQESQASDSSPE